jgi:hypothetical protein
VKFYQISGEIYHIQQHGTKAIWTRTYIKWSMDAKSMRSHLFEESKSSRGQIKFSLPSTETVKSHYKEENIIK